MKKIASVAGLVLAMTTNIFAGGPTIEPPTMVTAEPVPTWPEWTGLYVGLNGGYSWRNNHTDFTPLPSATAFQVNAGTVSFDMTGGLYGGQVGYDWQVGEEQCYLVGLETDFEHSMLKGYATQSAAANGAAPPFASGTTFANGFSTNEKVEWFGTFRPVLGVLTEDDNLLLYITGGLSYGSLEESANANFTPTDTHQYPVSRTLTQLGWVGGAGFEWKFSKHISSGFQYLYYDLGYVNGVANAVPNDNGLQMSYRWFNPANVVKLDLNYRF